MSKRPADGTQTDTISRFSPQVQESFDLKKLDGFVTGLGVDFLHYRAMPSPIGKKDRGDYRREDGVDTITSNGMIYTCAGKFTGTMTDNSREQKRSAGGVLDPSEARLVMPRFYNSCTGMSDADRIYLMPGDRLYVADKDADVLVANAQEIDYDPDRDNEALYPIVKIQDIVDSRNQPFTCGTDFEITPMGNIRWIAGGRNPGIDNDTGKGRIYSVRYLYKAFYYVVALPKEVRVTNVTTAGVRAPERMAYHAIIVREYIFHNQNRGDKQNQNQPKQPQRADAPPTESTNPNRYAIPVDMSTIYEGDE